MIETERAHIETEAKMPESEKIKRTIHELRNVVTTMEEYLKVKEFCDNEGIEIQYEGVREKDEIAYPSSIAGEHSDTHNINNTYEAKKERILKQLTPEQIEKIEKKEQA